MPRRRKEDPRRDGIQGILFVVPRVVAFRLIMELVPGTPAGIAAQEVAIDQLRWAKAPLEMQVTPNLRMYIMPDHHVWMVQTSELTLAPEFVDMFIGRVSPAVPTLQAYPLPWPGDADRLAKLPHNLPRQLRNRYLSN